MSDTALHIDQPTSLISVVVKSSSGATEAVGGLDRAATTVADLKALLAARPGGVPAEAQRLIYKGRVMKDEMTLEHYDVTTGQTIHLVKSGIARDAAAPPASAAAPAPAPSPPAATNSGSGFMFPGASPFGAGTPSPWSGAGAGAGAASPFSAASMQAQAQALMRDPEAARQMMNSPMMQSLMSNPDVLRDMITSNPQMQAMLDANPHIRHVLNDPALMRQTMEMMRSPAAMQEAMRHQDLALSNLENHPEGYNALRRMYEDIQEPMMDAARAAAAGAAAPQTPSSSWPHGSAGAAQQQNPNTAALPNPWGSPSPAASPPFGGMGGSFAPGGMFPPMGGAGAGMGAQPNAAQLNAMMQNPMMRQAMNEMLANPALMNQMISSNPMLRQMAASNPALGAMLADPALMQRMMDPQNMQAMLQMQQSMEQLQRSGLMPGADNFGGMGIMPPAGGGAPPSIAGLDFSALLGGAPAAFPAAAPPALGGSDPAVRFASQLRQLAEMGFTDAPANIRALTAAGGNVNAAVERLLSGL